MACARDFSAWYWLGIAQQQLGRKAEAKKDFERVITLAPSRVPDLLSQKPTSAWRRCGGDAACGLGDTVATACTVLAARLPAQGSADELTRFSAVLSQLPARTTSTRSPTSSWCIRRSTGCSGRPDPQSVGTRARGQRAVQCAGGARRACRDRRAVEVADGLPATIPQCDFDGSATKDRAGVRAGDHPARWGMACNDVRGLLKARAIELRLAGDKARR